LLNRARRRHFVQLVLEQSGMALGFALAGLVLLLLTGTQVLDWYWLVILFGCSFGFGLWRISRRVPSRYTLAQHVDRRLKLYDSLSTAVNFEDNERRAGSEKFRVAQREQADHLARTIDIRTAFPFSLPKGLYAAGGIALVAFGMFALRYGLTRSLDLRPSLVRIAFDSFFKPQETADTKKTSLRQKIEDELKKLGITMNATDAKANTLDPAANSALTPPDTPDTNSTGESDTAKSQAPSVPNQHESSDPGSDEKSERASASGSDQNSSDQPPEGNDGQPQNGKQQPQSKDGKQANSDNSSMMDKMRDAMSNLLNKLKMNSKPGEGKQSAQNSQQNGQQGKADKGQMPGKQQPSSGANAQDQQAQQSQGDPSQSAQGKSGDKDADKQASQDAKSGIGKQDGDKSAREAEQMAAMGKISEILGKRAQNMSGEVMLEVAGGKQQLKTQYSSKNAAHAEAGGEISRDEVPIEYQEYVQQYFEQIRKIPSSAPLKRGGTDSGAVSTPKRTE
jgi:hypothetical protein